jgi:cobalt-zinc-cadmium efflux system protein
MHAHVATRRALAWVLALNVAFFVVELVSGWRANSLALLSDAGHMLGDVGAIALSLAAAVFAARPAAPDKTFGYWRTEILAALVNGVALVVIAALVLVEAIRRIGAPPPVPGMTVALVGGAGLVVNLLSAMVLHRGSAQDLNVRGAYLHTISDALGSAGALVAGLVVLRGGPSIADPIASGFIGLLVAFGGFRLLRATVHVLMEGVPARIRMDRLRAAMETTEGVAAVHDLHVWSVASRFAVLSAHVVTGREGESNAVLVRLRRMLREDFALEHVTLQIESVPAAGSPAEAPATDPACAPCDETVEPRRVSGGPA